MIEIDLLNFVWSPEGHLTAFSAALVTILATQWLKLYLADWRFTSLVALGVAVASQMIAVALSASGMWFEAFWTGVLGASLATFGWEMLFNLLGTAGIGARSDKALLARAKATVRDN